MFFFSSWILPPVPHQTWRTPRRIWIVLFYSKFLQIFDPHGGNVLTTHIATGFFGREPVTSIPKSVNISGRPKFMVIHFAIPKTVVLANKKHRSNVKTCKDFVLVTAFWLIVSFVDWIHFNSLQLFPQSPWQATKKSKKHLPKVASESVKPAMAAMVKTRRPNSIKQHLQHKSLLKKTGGAELMAAKSAKLTCFFWLNLRLQQIDGLNNWLDFATRNTYHSIYPLMGLQTLEFKKRGTHVHDFVQDVTWHFQNSQVSNQKGCCKCCGTWPWISGPWPSSEAAVIVGMSS